MSKEDTESGNANPAKSTNGHTNGSRLASTNLEGQLLIAMPELSDRHFGRSVVYMCAHSEEGAMGLVINKPAPSLNLGKLLKQIDAFEDEEIQLTVSEAASDRPVHLGGPVEETRGFVIHSPDYKSDDGTVEVDDDICLTATTDILRAIASGSGPSRVLLALGYAGWGPGQLEGELAANGWLTCAANPDLVFLDDASAKYDRALSIIGVDLSHLSNAAGHA